MAALWPNVGLARDAVTGKVANPVSEDEHDDEDEND